MTLSSVASDAEVLEFVTRIRAGDRQALGAWFEANVDSLFAFVFHRVGSDREAAADVTQATLADALRQLGSFDPNRGTMQAWLRVRSRNHIRAAVRHSKRHVTMLEVWEGIDTRLEELYRQMAAEPLPDEILERNETRELVGATLASLPEHYRDLLEAKYVAEESLESLAASRSTTTDSIKSLLRRARAAFKETFIAIAEVEIAEPEITRS